MRFIRSFILITACLALLAGCGINDQPAPGTDHSVPAVDLQRYLGLWYSVASLPAPFQDGCHCTTAEYIARDGYIEVINRCRKGSPKGAVDQAHGKAWPMPGSNNSRLKVSFFWPFKGDYWVIDLDPDYRWAVVGHPERKYLWILSRTPRLPDGVYEQLVGKARSLGYAVDRLQRIDQSCN